MPTAPCYAMSPVVHRPRHRKNEKYGGATPKPPLCIVPDITRPKSTGALPPNPRALRAGRCPDPPSGGRSPRGRPADS